MKLVVCSDAHLDWQTIGRARFDDVEAAMWQVARCAVESKANAFMFLGDLCDPDSGPPVFRCVWLAVAIASFLKEKGIRSIWLAGNHDVIEDGSGMTTLSPVGGVGALTVGNLVHVVEQPCALTFDERTVLCLPFTAASRSYDPAKAVEQLAQGRKGIVSITHLSVPGIIPGEETTEMPRGREVVFPVAEVKPIASIMLGGHYHRRQVSPDGVQIVGALQRLTFGEEDHQPGFLVVEV